ncbi:MAG: hypothetical protein ACHQK8_03720 [Bacteroidia bacterium]
MRRFLLILCVAVICSPAFSQKNEYFPSQSEIGEYMMRWKQVAGMRNNRVKKFIEKKQDEKTREYFRSAESEINPLGLSVKTVENSPGGKVASWHLHTFVNDTLPEQTIYYNGKSEIMMMEKFYYDERFREIKTEEYERNEKMPAVTWKSEYNDFNQMISYTCLDKKGRRIFRYEYGYLDNKSNKETKYFNRKGKMTRHWTYDGDQKGKERSEEQEMGNFSKKYSLNPDGSYIWTFEDRDAKDKIKKTLCYFSADGLMNKWEQFDRKGTLLLREIYTYDKNKNNTQTVISDKDGLKSQTLFEYNDKNLCTRQTQFDKNGKPVLAIGYEYEFYSKQ